MCHTILWSYVCVSVVIAFIEQLANAATNSIPIASSVAAADKPSDDSTTSKG